MATDPAVDPVVQNTLSSLVDTNNNDINPQPMVPHPLSSKNNSNNDDDNKSSDPLTSQNKDNKVNKPQVDDIKNSDKDADPFVQLISLKILMIRKSDPFFVDIKLKSTVLDLKKIIEKKMIEINKDKIRNNNDDDNDNDNDDQKEATITADRMRLIYRGHALKNNKTIEKENIKNGHAVHLVPHKGKTKTDDPINNNNNNIRQQTFNHLPYNNVVCPKCGNHLCLTQPVLCYAYLWANRGIMNSISNDNNNNNNINSNGKTLQQVLNENDNKSQEENKNSAHCDMDGCPSPYIGPRDYTYHCPNRRCHPFGYDLCQNCARYVNDPFCNMDIATNHVLKYQLNMFADIFFERYRDLINQAIGGQSHENDAKGDDEKQSTPTQTTTVSPSGRGRGRGRGRGVVRGRGGVSARGRGRGRGRGGATIPVITMNKKQYVQLIDDEGNIILVPKERFDAVEAARNKVTTIDDVRNIVCNNNSEFRKRVAAVIANPRIIREIFQKECPTLLRDSLWIRKFLSEAFEHIECRIYIQARMAIHLQDIINMINDIMREKGAVQANRNKELERLNNIKTFKILKASSTQWVNDDKVTRCQSCGSSFGFFSRKHHCKACGDIFCSKHCIERIYQPNRNLMKNSVNLPKLRIKVCQECSTKYKYYTYTNIPKLQ